MPTPIEQRPTELRKIAKRFEDRLRIARASELASFGRLLEAEAHLCPDLQIPMSAAELDLLARIYVKQRKYGQARKRWEDAVKAGDRGSDYVECIKALDDWLDYRNRMLIWKLKLGFLSLAILLTIWILARNVFTTPM